MSNPGESVFGLSVDTLRAATNVLPSQKEMEELVEVVRRGQERLERSRQYAEEYINIGPPWDYDPDDYSPSEEAIFTAMKWTHEGQTYLESTGDQDLVILSRRIEEGSRSFAEESDDPETEYPYKGLHLLLSSLDGLITWLCENDPEIEPSHCNAGDKPVYLGSQKKPTLEKWYNEHAIFGVEDNEGEAFKEKWNDFWHHRHRIMHGSPHAYYDTNIGVATLFFVGLTAHVVKERYNQLN